MNVDINQFWKLLSESKLIEPIRFQTLFAELNSGGDSGAIKTQNSGAEFNPDEASVQGQSENNSGRNRENSAAQIAKQLVTQNVITEYQSEILLAGHAGPFWFGNYVIQEKLNSELSNGCFSAIHGPTGQPVQLEFVTGNGPADLESWRRTEAVVSRLSTLKSVEVSAVFESVVLPEHRMIVSQRPSGVPISQKLPVRSRLPWKDACRIGLQIAQALFRLDQNSIVHGYLNPHSVWVLSGGAVQLRMHLVAESPSINDADKEASEVPSIRHSSALDIDYVAPELIPAGSSHPDLEKATHQSDLFSLGCMLVRLITGNPPAREKSGAGPANVNGTPIMPSFEKYDVPQPLVTVITNLLAAEPQNRLASSTQAVEAIEQIMGGPLKIQYPPELFAKANPTLRRYRQQLERWNLTQERTTTDQEPVEVTVIAQEPERHSTRSNHELAERAIELAKRRKNKKWMLPATIGGAMLLVSGIVAGIVVMTSRPVPTPTATNDPAAATHNDSQNKKRADAESPSAADLTQQAILAGQQLLVQDLVDDDGETLWESPTVGKPVEISFLPPAPKLYFRLRPAAFLENGEAEKILQSLGPQFANSLTQFEQAIGFELEQLESLSITLHTSDDFVYQPFFLIQLKETVPNDRLLQIWQGPTAVESENQQTIYQRSENAFYLIPDSAAADECKQFLFGPESLVRTVVEARGLGQWSGSMGRMVDWLDADHHFAMLFQRAGLFNDEGQKLMTGPWAPLNQGLRLFLDDNVRGGLFSLHIDEGNYLEFKLDRSADLKANELESTVEQRLEKYRDSLIQIVSSIRPNPYWDRVRLRYDNMLSDVYRNLRVEVEYGQVTGNCWLPPMAMHNLIAASELMLTYSGNLALAAGDQATSGGNTRTVPQTLEALMAAKRDLSVTTNPDLNILLSSIRDEVVEDWVELPFEFNIRILANDLSEEGITQNQRPGDFELKQTSLADVLTQIMVRCNPDQNATGASDPNCKLVWVIGPLPENPSQSAVLITTRAAAAKKSYALPAAFQIDE